MLGAGALGADQLIDRFKTDAVSTDVRLRLWRDGLRVFAAHPLGIGRGAFERVFPIYRTLKMPFPLRFAFVENQPLQLLIDCGWFFFAPDRRRARRRSRGELCGTVAATRSRRRSSLGCSRSLVHSIVDFGLETLGVLLPFVAILGTVLGRLPACDRGLAARREMRLGRARRWPRPPWSSGSARPPTPAPTTSTPSSDSHELPDARHELLVGPRRSTPSTTSTLSRTRDSSRSRVRPERRPLGSTRSTARCASVRPARRCTSRWPETSGTSDCGRQALLEWRTAVDLQPSLFTAALGELFSTGAKPQELAAVASSRSDHMLELVAFLRGRGRIPDAFVVLDQADALGAPRGESLLARARLQLEQGQPAAAAATAEQARQLGIQDPRLAVLQARLTLANKGVKGVDEALAILNLAATRAPTDVQVQSERIELVVTYKKWQAAERSLEGLKQALYQSSRNRGRRSRLGCPHRGRARPVDERAGRVSDRARGHAERCHALDRIRAGGDVRRTRRNGARGARPGGAPQPQQSRDHRCAAGGQRAPGALAGERGMSRAADEEPMTRELVRIAAF